MSVREIKTNHPGDGNWVMRRVHGVFNDQTDHVMAVHRDGETVGGVVFTGYLGATIMLHMAGSEDNWATRDFLIMVFHYAFVQLGCRKLLGLVAASNTRALKIDDHLGFHEVAYIPDVYLDGDGLVILEMYKSECWWLRFTPKYYRSKGLV